MRDEYEARHDCAHADENGLLSAYAREFLSPCTSLPPITHVVHGQLEAPHNSPGHVAADRSAAAAATPPLCNLKQSHACTPRPNSHLLVVCAPTTS